MLKKKLQPEIWFAKTHSDAKIPTKRDEDAGYDIYPAFDGDGICIDPHTTVMISAGVCSAFSDDYVMVLKERGSTGTKGIGQRCGVIDSGFRDTWQIPITNENDYPIFIVKKDVPFNYGDGKCVIYPYEKAIAQALLLPVPKVTIVEKTIEEVLNVNSERQTGMLGSSGK